MIIALGSSPDQSRQINPLLSGRSFGEGQGMVTTRRIVIVRRGDEELFERLRERYARDPDTVVRYDRRAGSRRSAGPSRASERRRGERRLPHEADIVLATRGYYVIRAQQRRSLA